MKRAIVLIAALVFWGGVCRARTITVDDDGPADFNNIQAAIDDANDGDTVIVSPGRYYENINFSGKNIVLRSTNPTDSAIVEATIIDGSFLDSVVMFSGTESADCVLSGLTITRGGGHGTETRRYGGGIYGNGTLATIEHNLITDNWALGGWPGTALGGGIYDCDGIIRYNVIRNNEANADMGEVAGGGLYGCDGVIRFNLISDNYARFYGGGLALCNGTIEHNVIRENTSSRFGGGLFWCDGIVRNNLIHSNQARDSGGGMSCYRGDLQQNTIVMNRGGAVHIYEENTVLSNCILWGNGLGEIIVSSGSVDVTYCDVEGGWPGTGNISADPCFVDPNNGDYYLKSQAGRWDPNTELWVTDGVTSPCIDAGDPISPIELEPFPNGGIVNMGAYGGTDEASKSWFGGPPCEVIVAGDVNGDCDVDFLDFRIMALHWLEEH